MSRIKLLAYLAAGGLIALMASERRRPLRKQCRPELPRNLRNAAMGAMCAAVIQPVEVPLTQRIAIANAHSPRGIAAWLPRSLRAIAGFVLMDYMFYLWHIATHKSRFLWRFHRVHHIDPDMDSSTAVRFHAVGMLVSLPWRLLQVRCSGIAPGTLSVWRTFFNASILFHHSNLQLPDGWDRRLSWLLTTPKMHGIHHSIVPAERDSNWSSGLSLWDRLHGTYREDVLQSDIDIGVADSRAAADLSLPASLSAPFKRIPMSVE
ncbi:MAG: sterol desaturase family protein [Alphaproteobacteria bacterium]|jgi:sterol desaturase/sphingolipid hydroxylase (fatty acid hydroxylase superfamily)|nr:sterol desaturase family protein [Alphaproteobacteria bacterium]